MRKYLGQDSNLEPLGEASVIETEAETWCEDWNKIYAHVRNWTQVVSICRHARHHRGPMLAKIGKIERYQRVLLKMPINQTYSITVTGTFLTKKMLNNWISRKLRKKRFKNNFSFRDFFRLSISIFEKCKFWMKWNIPSLQSFRKISTRFGKNRTLD